MKCYFLIIGFFMGSLLVGSLPALANYGWADSADFSADLLTVPVGGTVGSGESADFGTDLTGVNRAWADSADFTIDTTVSECTITAWRSVRFHGGSVNADLAIELNASATGSDVVAEPRRDGIQRIEVDFNVDITGRLSGTVEAENLNFPGHTCSATSQTLINDGQTLVIEFADCLPGSEAGLPDEICYRIDLAGVIAGLTGDTDCLIVGLQGDTNNDHNTNLIDMAQTKSMNGSPVVGDDIRFDVNLDGNVNLIDMALVKSLNGHSATCP